MKENSPHIKEYYNGKLYGQTQSREMALSMTTKLWSLALWWVAALFFPSLLRRGSRQRICSYSCLSDESSPPSLLIHNNLFCKHPQTYTYKNNAFPVSKYFFYLPWCKHCAHIENTTIASRDSLCTSSGAICWFLSAGIIVCGISGFRISTSGVLIFWDCEFGDFKP